MINNRYSFGLLFVILVGLTPVNGLIVCTRQHWNCAQCQIKYTSVEHEKKYPTAKQKEKEKELYSEDGMAAFV